MMPSVPSMSFREQRQYIPQLSGNKSERAARASLQLLQELSREELERDERNRAARLRFAAWKRSHAHQTPSGVTS